MKEQTSAWPYARALFTLSQKLRFNALRDITVFMEALNQCDNLRNLLFLDIFTIEEKRAVFSDIAKKLSLNETVKKFIDFLLEQKRISLLPVVCKEISVLDGESRGVLKGVLEGNLASVPARDMKNMEKALKGHLNKVVELTYKQTKKSLQDTELRWKI